MHPTEATDQRKIQGKENDKLKTSASQKILQGKSYSNGGAAEKTYI